jgi:hypothetical protein
LGSLDVADTRVGGVSLAWLGPVLVEVLSGLGLVLGIATAAGSHARDRRRKAFVDAAERGTIPGYRVDATEEGRVLVRVMGEGAGYRVAEQHEALVELSDDGEMRSPQRPRATISS